MKKGLLFLSIIFLLSCREKSADTIDVKEPSTVLKTAPKSSKPTINQLITSSKTYQLGEITVVVNHKKGDALSYYCSADVIIYKALKELDRISFSDIEAVGGYFGISDGIVINDHLVFTKHGDYDGRTIIVNNEGVLHNIIGGTNYVDISTQMLMTIYDSDLSGIAVYDLGQDQLIFELEDIEDRPGAFYKIENNRFIVDCVNDENDEKSVWEIEFELERIMQIEANDSMISSQNQLTYLNFKIDDCSCDNY